MRKSRGHLQGAGCQTVQKIKKKEWNCLSINKNNVNKFYQIHEDQQKQEQAQTVLVWALGVLKDSVFDRGDYKNY